MIAMRCDRCNAPMKTRRECGFCGTEYYVGPEIQEYVPMQTYSFRTISTAQAITSTLQQYYPYHYDGMVTYIVPGQYI